MRRALLLSIVLSACGPAPATGDGGPRDAASGARVELGTGTSGFVELPDGARLELVSGPQGGFHVNLTARLYDLDVDGLRIRYVAVPVGATAPISMPTELELNAMRVTPEGDHLLRAGDFLVMAIDAPAEIVGMEVELTVSVTDPGGRRAEDSRRVQIVDEVIEGPTG